MKTINLYLANKGGYNLYELIEAAYKLNISSFDTAIRKRVIGKDYSRSAKDISILINVFSIKA